MRTTWQVHADALTLLYNFIIVITSNWCTPKKRLFFFAKQGSPSLRSHWVRVHASRQVFCYFPTRWGSSESILAMQSIFIDEITLNYLRWIVCHLCERNHAGQMRNLCNSNCMPFFLVQSRSKSYDFSPANNEQQLPFQNERNNNNCR